MKRRFALWKRLVLAATLLLSLIAAGAWALWLCCGPPSRTRMGKEIARLPSCFPAFEKLQVTMYRNQDWCKNMVYGRGAFSRNTESTCNLFDEVPQPFDAEAEADFETVAKAMAATKVGYHFVNGIEYDPHGKLVAATFHLSRGRCEYVYSPNHGPLPPDDPHEREYTPLNKDWYYVWNDWN